MSIVRNILSRSYLAISASRSYTSTQAPIRKTCHMATLAKTHGIMSRALKENASMKQPPLLSFEKFKGKHIESFETGLESLKEIFPEVPISKHEEIYKASCESQYKNYVQVMTPDNDPGTLL